ncbi:MAG: FAD-binding oxidoreductase [Myxococcaceae bacterium]
MQPSDRDQLGRVLQFCNRRQIPLTVRGSGYSQGGQSIPAAGATLQMARMDRIGPVNTKNRTVHCQTGARWRSVIAATLPAGLLPKVIPLNLDMTVGGLLSAGGVGATSHHHGFVVSHVQSLELVTADGAVHTCTREVEAPLYHLALGGVGRVGVIATASLELRQVLPQVRVFHLFYDSVEPWLSDQARVIETSRATYLEGFCWAGPKDLRSGARGRRYCAKWLYGLQLGVECSPDSPPAEREVLAGLRPSEVLLVEDVPLEAHIHRYEPRFDVMHRSGAWHQAHPWLEAFLAPVALARVLPSVLDELPGTFGDGHKLLWVATRGAPLYLALHPEPIVVCLALLPVGIPEGLLSSSLEAIRRVDRMLLEAGGKRYLSGWLEGLDAAQWRAHFGRRYEGWTRGKQQHDPSGLFQSLLFPGGPP